MHLTSVIQHHLDVLATQIGQRMIGSPGNVAAADYIEGIFSEANLATRRQTYPCPSWQAEFCNLCLNGQSVDATVNTFSPSCEVTARLVVVRTLEELASVNAEQAILVLLGELTDNPIMSLVEHAVYLPERDRKIGLLLREKSPQAIVTVSQAPGYTPILLEDPRLNIPSVTVSAEVGLLLVQQAASPVTLQIGSRAEPGQTCNLIGTNLRPTADRRLILCAHYDTKNGTCGAWDNASGVAALLALAQMFAREPSPISLEFIAFSAEEYSIEDSFADPYLAPYGLTIPPFVYGQEIAAPYRPSGLDQVLAVINFDGIGQAVTANTVATMACSNDLKALVGKVKADFKGMVAVNGWPASNHYGFYANGIPSIPIGSIEMKNILHDMNDTVAWLSIEQISETVAFAQQLILMLADKSPEWCRMPRSRAL